MHSLIFEVITGRFCYLSSYLTHVSLQITNFGTQSCLQIWNPNSDTVFIIIIIIVVVFVIFFFNLEMQYNTGLKFMNIFAFLKYSIFFWQQTWKFHIY